MFLITAIRKINEIMITSSDAIHCAYATLDIQILAVRRMFVT